MKVKKRASATAPASIRSGPAGKASLLVLSALLALLPGCASTVRNEYQRPALTLPERWQQPTDTAVSPSTATITATPWWTAFDDSVLDDLIDRALRSNNDLAAAAIRVRRAQLQSSLADTNLTPGVTLGANAAASRDLKSGTTQRNSNITAALSYELDLWGKLASERDAARWEADASKADRQNTALLLVGTTAAAYWQIAYLNQRIALSESSIAYTQKSLDLAEAKYRAGAVSQLDVVQAGQNLTAQEANLTQLIQQRTEARHALAILFNQPPEAAIFTQTPEPQQLPENEPPAVDAGLPASLLAQRPDLAAAELRLRESLANVDSTRASFYPTFTLTGNLGSSSTSLTDILRNPVAALGIGLTLPFIQWNTTQLTIRVSETQYEEAVVNFRQTLYNALRDVENALAACRQYQAEGVKLAETLALTQKAEHLAGIRYRAGATGLQNWLDEQDRRRSAEAGLAQNRLNQLNASMKLYQALGGGMEKTMQTAQIMSNDQSLSR